MITWTKRLQEYHPMVWVLLIGTVFARCASTMSLPFLAIYLSTTEGMDPLTAGFTVGLSALASTVGGFVGGNLSDRYGRGVVMISTLFVWAGTFIGFATANQVWLFMGLNFFNGLCRSFFEPTGQALIADVTPPEKRMHAFGMRYFAINVGAAVGPLLGGYLAIASSASITFWITGVFYLFYAFLLLVMFLRFRPQVSVSPKHEKVTFMATFNIVRKDTALGFFILASMMFLIGYSQIESNLAIYLKNEGMEHLFPILITTNAITVVACQMLVNRWAEKRSILLNMAVGTGLGSFGLLLFGIGNHWTVFVVGMIILSLGEILIFPTGSLFIDQLAKEGMRGTYFGARGFQSLGTFVGPTLGGWMLGMIGGHWMFVILSIIAASGMIFYWIGLKEFEARQQVKSHTKWKATA